MLLLKAIEVGRVQIMHTIQITYIRVAPSVEWGQFICAILETCLRSSGLCRHLAKLGIDKPTQLRDANL
jgi:hypothetical protein